MRTNQNITHSRLVELMVLARLHVPCIIYYQERIRMVTLKPVVIIASTKNSNTYCTAARRHKSLLLHVSMWPAVLLLLYYGLLLELHALAWATCSYALLLLHYTIGTCSCTCIAFDDIKVKHLAVEWYEALIVRFTCTIDCMCTHAPVSEVRCALIGRLSLCCRVLRLRVMTWPSTVPPAASLSPSRKPWCTWRGASLRYSIAAGHASILVLCPAPSYVPSHEEIGLVHQVEFLGQDYIYRSGHETNEPRNTKILAVSCTLAQKRYYDIFK